ncbi:MAG TPA: transcription termination/antitermination protein NusA [Candidatus Binatia bacterium]|nr:transcription termination/antitermination protein NusA [Candidatus Binatia bacterium]
MAKARGRAAAFRPGAHELLDAVSELAADAGISEQELTEIVGRAIVETYRRLVEDDPGLFARVDFRRGLHDVLRRGEGGAETLMPPLGGDAARQAAQAVRSAVLDRLRSAGAERVLHEAAMRRGELIDAVVESRAGGSWYLQAGDLTVVLPPEEQAGGEVLIPRQHLKVVVLEGRMRAKDAVVVASRSHPQLVRLLLDQEVPELGRGQVVIRAIAREAGRRTKVAVESTDPDIDPQGACIGPRGIRHRAVTSQLGAEQLQVVRYDPDPARYVANALIPAAVQGVELDPATRTARVTVDSSQLSLAIGRGGENARLAARLTGWRIDIVGSPHHGGDGEPGDPDPS